MSEHELTLLKNNGTPVSREPRVDEHGVLHLTGANGCRVHILVDAVTAVEQVIEGAHPAYEMGLRALVFVGMHGIGVRDSHTEVTRLLGWEDA